MIKNILVPIVFLFTLVTFAQEGTSSPYSFYGLGDVKFKGTAENRAMGGLTVASDSIHINFQNPASYAALKLTSFTVGASYLTTKLETNSQKENARRTALDYLAIGLPFRKGGVGFGLVPYSSVGYKIQSTTTEDPITIKKYTGTGGINKVFFGFGYQILPKLSLGADMSYYFGKIETNGIKYIQDVQYGSKENNKSDIYGFSTTLGLNYQTKINNKLTLLGSLTYATQGNLRSSNSRTISSVQYSASGTEIQIDPLEIPVDNTTLKLPSKLAFGVAIGQQKKWLIGTEITNQRSSNLGNRFNDISNVKFENATKYTLGGYFIPNYNSFSKYLEKFTYRAGLRYENTGLIINDKSINDYGLTLGLGIPITGSFSNVNIGFELGKRGTTSAGLVLENYANISIGLSFNDKWFVKKLYY
jgi:long-subunit fatty acid transport protein